METKTYQMEELEAALRKAHAAAQDPNLSQEQREYRAGHVRAIGQEIMKLRNASQQPPAPPTALDQAGNTFGDAMTLTQNVNPVGAAAAELAASVGTGAVGVAESLFDGLMAGFDGDENYDKIIDDTMQSRTYAPRTKGAQGVAQILGEVGDAATFFPSMLYASVKNLPDILTEEEKEEVKAQIEQDRQRFRESPSRALGKDVQSLTGSPAAGASTEAALNVLAMVAGARSPKEVGEINRMSRVRQIKKLEETLQTVGGVTPNMLKVIDKKTGKPKNITPEMLREQEDLTPEQREAMGQYVQKSAAAKEALRQGFTMKDVGFFSSFRKQDKPAIKRMIKMAKKSMIDKRFQNENSLYNPVSDALATRYKFHKSKNDKAKKRIKKVVENNKDLKVNFDDSLEAYTQGLENLDVKVDRDNGYKLDFKNSDLEDSPEGMNYIELITNRLRSRGGQTLQAGHRLKRYIDESNRPTGKGALSKSAVAVVDSLRKNINNDMRSASPAYKKVNKQFSETKEILDKFQKFAGKDIDLSSDTAKKVLGLKMRRIFSNAVDGVKLEEFTKEVDRIAGKYGAKFDNSLTDQTLAATELIDLFDLAKQGTLNKQVRAGIGQNAARAAMEDPTLSAVRGAGNLFDRTIGQKLFNINDDAALKALEDLLDE